MGVSCSVSYAWNYCRNSGFGKSSCNEMTIIIIELDGKNLAIHIDRFSVNDTELRLRRFYHFHRRGSRETCRKYYRSRRDAVL